MNRNMETIELVFNQDVAPQYLDAFLLATREELSIVQQQSAGAHLFGVASDGQIARHLDQRIDELGKRIEILSEMREDGGEGLINIVMDRTLLSGATRLLEVARSDLAKEKPESWGEIYRTDLVQRFEELIEQIEEM